MGCGLLCRERKVVSEEWIEENGARRMESAVRRVFGQCSAYGVVCHAFVVCTNVVAHVHSGSWTPIKIIFLKASVLDI